LSRIWITCGGIVKSIAMRYHLRESFARQPASLFHWVQGSPLPKEA
jgi:hypothetical protein